MKKFFWLIFIIAFLVYAVLHSVHFFNSYNESNIDIITLIANLGGPIFILICSGYLFWKKVLQKDTKHSI
jgi:cytochrome c oxidase assembly factor CtaG